MLAYDALAVTNAEADAYILARGLSGWPALEAEQDTALRRGQDYVAREYNGRWVEEWTTAPEVVKSAIFEAALVEAVTPGALSPVVTLATDKVLTEVKGIKWTPLRTGGGANEHKPTLTAIEALLASVVTGSGNAKVLLRS